MKNSSEKFKDEKFKDEKFKDEKFKDEKFLNAIVYYEELLNLFCEMLECKYSPFDQDEEINTLLKEKFTTIQDYIIKQYKIILDLLDGYNKKNLRIFKRLDAFINNLIILAVDASKMALIGGLSFSPFGRDKFEENFKYCMESYFSKFLGNLKDLKIPNIKLDNLANFDNFDKLAKFDLYDSITKIEDIRYIADEKVVEYFDNVIALLKPYNIKRSPLTQEVKNNYVFLKSKGKLVESIREIAKYSNTKLYPLGMYFELKPRIDVRNIFHNNTEFKFYCKSLTLWRDSYNTTIEYYVFATFDNLVDYFCRDFVKNEPNFLLRRMRDVL